MRQRSSRLSPGRGQEGLASIIVVSVLIIIMTLITIGFTRLVNRSAVNSANRQFSASATYAAESGINDVASYLKKYAADPLNSGTNLLPKSTSCTGNGSLIGNATIQGPFYNKSQLSSNSSTIYTCLLLNPTPSRLVYNQIQSLKSQVVKINTSASSGALDKILVSWKPSDSQITGYPTSSSNLNDETTWNNGAGTCKDSGGANASCIPMLRLVLFPVSNGELLSSAQIQSKTIFLYPKAGGASIPSPTYASLSDGSIFPVTCTKNIGGAANFNISSVGGYVCNLIIRGLSGAITPNSTDSIYMRITPIYNQADVQLAANDQFGNSLNFINDQAVVDVTAQTAGVVKRLQARVDTSSLVNGASGIDTDVSSDSNGIPEQAVRSANALCKREVLYQPGGYASYIGMDDPTSVCNDGGINIPVPSMNLSISASNGADQGKTWPPNPPGSSSLDSTLNNTDSPQSPKQQATVYTGAGTINGPSAPGQTTVIWSTTDATNCTGTGGTGGDGWAGNKTPLMTFSGSPTVAGQGSQSVTDQYYSEYDLQCDRPGSPGPSALKKVFNWPYPTVWFNPTSVTAGQGYSITWNVANTITCTASGDAGANGAWAGAQNASDKLATFSLGLGTWGVTDTSSRTYTITCKDPIGRTVVNSITLGHGQSDVPGNPNAPTTDNVNPPACYGDWSVTDNLDGTGTMTFNGACPPPPYNPLTGFYQFNNCTPDLNAAIGGNCGGAGVGNAATLTVGVGNYCANYNTGIGPWGTISDSGYKCYTVNPPLPPMAVDFGSSSGLWDQGPSQCSWPTAPNSLYNGTWWCRNGRVPNTSGAPGCADGVHRWTMCDMWWNVTGGSGNHTCTLQSLVGGYGVVHKGGEIFWSTGSLGWGNSGSPSPFNLYCTDNVTGQFVSIVKNIP